MPSSLTHAEAVHRGALLTVTSMVVDLDLTRGPELFGSTATITFTVAADGDTFLDWRPAQAHELTLDGEPLPHPSDGRTHLALTVGEHTITAIGEMRYSRDGQGLHRSVDPADGEAYVYGHLFLDAAPRVFACFDQPDLKAPYTLSVTAPQEWTVLGNGAATSAAPGRWSLATTPPLATYFVTVCAGPWASVCGEHDGIPLGVHARASLAEPLRAQAEDILATTRACFDRYHRLFGIRYPFGEYHQVFVPEFNAGAMENPGCVTFRDQLIPRGAATPEESAERASTIAHEMAHMWFGDLVTMRWWDDLWLNESFAEYMSYAAMAEITGSTDPWVSFGINRKVWGYAAERSPSTHPVAGSPAPDALTALGNFDGISYAKGAAVLRQLIAHLGGEVFGRGVADYLRDNAYGSGEFAEFIASMERASGMPLADWSRSWLLTAGADTLSWAEGVLSRTVPEEFPADRSHTLDVAAFASGAEIARCDVTLDGPRVVANLGELPSGRIVVPNAADLTWAVLTLDPESVGALVSGLRDIPDEIARVVVWTALLGSVPEGTLDPRRVLDVIEHNWPHERHSGLLARVGLLARTRLIDLFLAPDEQRAAQDQLARAAEASLARGGAVAAARVLVSVLADVERLQAWRGGEGDILPELRDDKDFHWSVLSRLAALGAVDADDIDRARAQDPSLSGQLAALTSQARIPTAAAKTQAWRDLTERADISNYEAIAIASGFWTPDQPDLTAAYLDQFPDAMVRMSQHLGGDAMDRVVIAAYPSLVGPRTEAMGAAMLGRKDLTPSVRRSAVDADSRVREALRSLARYR